MIKQLTILVLILSFSCEDNNSSDYLISNLVDINTEYIVNLNWNEDEEYLKTGVNIKWEQWKENPLFTFIKYEIKDVSTEQPKWIAYIDESDDTTYQVEFPTGTFYRLCVLAHYHDIENNLNFILSSDSTQFFTQPLSPITNLSINAQPLENILTWNPSSDQDINKLIIYRAEIAILNEAGNAPTLEASIISDNTGEIQDSSITSNNSGVVIGEWKKIYEGTNLDVTYNDLDASDPNYVYYYAINVKIEESEVHDETIIANYRYSLITPENENDEINSIQEQNINLSSAIDQDNIIIIHWDSYTGDDFYSYEIWRSDIESIDIESLENSGKMLVEITTQSQDFFEDISLVGSEKSFYYFIRVNNNYGDTIESNIIEGDTTL